MKVTERRAGSKERTILTGMIVDKLVLSRLSSKWSKDGLFDSQWSNIIAGWCVRYFSRHHKAPGPMVQKLFEAWAEDHRDKETVGLVEKYLATLSGEYSRLKKESNGEYVLDLAGKYFNDIALKKLAEKIEGYRENGETEKAHELVGKFNKIEVGVGAGIDVLTDQNALQLAFEDKREPLFKYPGSLGAFMNDALEREGLLAFMAPEKRGKTFWLMDAAVTAVEHRLKVAFFGAGDMSQNQYMRRFATRIARRPLRATKEGKPVRYPTTIERFDGDATVEFEEREYKKALSWQKAWEAVQSFCEHKVKSRDSLFKLSCHPTATISVKGIQSILQTWEYQYDWIPDVILIDYADILAPLNGADDSREATNKTWQALRSLSQQGHNLVITATQSNAASYKMETQDRSNFSEDKRKLAHATAIVAINQTLEEKQSQIQRLNWIVLREDEFFESKCVYVANCLAVANPRVRSTF